FLERTYLDRSTCVVSNQDAARPAPIPAWPPGTNGTRAPPPDPTRSCGPSMDCGPAVSSRRFLPRGILVPLDWPHLPWSELLGAGQRRSPGSETPISISANEHPFTPNDRTISWLLGLAKLDSVS